MPSFDVVSEFDAHEASNAIDQANREVGTRFDFKGTGLKYVLEDQVVNLTSQADFQLQQMLDILRQKLAKRGIDIACMKEEEVEITGSEARQKVILRKGIDTPLARDLVKQIKASKINRTGSRRGAPTHDGMRRITVASPALFPGPAMHPALPWQPVPHSLNRHHRAQPLPQLQSWETQSVQRR